MLIRIGYDIELAVATPMALIYLLRVHPSRRDDLVAPESVQVSGGLEPEEYIDSFGNHCGRVNVPVGMDTVRLTNEAVIRDSGELDEVNPSARQHDGISCSRKRQSRSLANPASSAGHQSNSAVFCHLDHHLLIVCDRAHQMSKKLQNYVSPVGYLPCSACGLFVARI